MPPLGPQWGRLARSLHTEGGFSVNLKGESPMSGYMVSEPQGEERTPLHETDSQTLLSYSARHRRALSQPDTYHGGWVDDGKVYQDISKSHEMWGSAYTHMVAKGQAGLYDVAGTGHPDTNPLYDRRTEETPVQRQMRGTAAMAAHPLARNPEFPPQRALAQASQRWFGAAPGISVDSSRRRGASQLRGLQRGVKELVAGNQERGGARSV